jgi:hypothetical protein
MRERLSEIGLFQCRWIRGEVEKDPLCCADPVFHYSSWCERHYRRVVSKNQGHSKAKVELMAKTGGIPYKG